MGTGLWGSGDRRTYDSAYDGRISRHRPTRAYPLGYRGPRGGRAFGGRYDRGYYRRPHYRDYRGFGRCYGGRQAYYRPYRYAHLYDGYWNASFGVYGYYQPLYRRAYDTSVIYTDTVVVEPSVYTETYYPAPATTIVQPTTTIVEPATTMVEPTRMLAMPESATVAPVTSAGPSSESAGTEDDAPESPAPAWVEKGNVAFAVGQYREARRLYARAMLTDVTDGYAKLFYGLANFATGYYGVAAEAFRRALIDAPELIDDPIDLRNFYSEPAKLATQMGELLRATGEQPEETELVFLLGYLYFATGEPQRAITTLQALTGPESKDILATLVRDAAIRVLPGEEGMGKEE